MLISFKVENFRSVRDCVELSMEAINYYKEQSEQLLEPALPGMSKVKFLRGAAVYGPNASGKSSFMHALSTMRDVVLASSRLSADDELPFQPYLLSNESRGKPTRFSVMFVNDGVRYEYGFSYTERLITEEKLSAYPKGREQVWFTRETVALEGDDGDCQSLIHASSYLGVPAALAPLLNGNSLLLSLLAKYPKLAESEKIRPVYEWFNSGLGFCGFGPNEADDGDDISVSGDILDGKRGSDYQRAFIQKMVRKADLGIVGTQVESEPFPAVDSRLLELYQEIYEVGAPELLKTVVFEHSAQEDSVKFDIADESGGTYRLFMLGGPVAQSLEYGSTLFVDELDASLHPVLACEVVRCFLSPESNPNGAQLVFTAHNPCLLEDGLLRRDQIWFTEKVDGATKLYPLSDFKPYKGESRVRGYLKGRYSATPVVLACFGMCNGFWSEDACGA